MKKIRDGASNRDVPSDLGKFDHSSLRFWKKIIVVSPFFAFFNEHVIRKSDSLK
jgi:hypothetical protein